MKREEFNLLDHQAELEDPSNHIAFDPVPRQRARRRGWSEARQRGFIFALSRCGSVRAAARAVGMSPRSAYALLDARGADSFAAAWDQAIDEGRERVRSDALGRALGGVFVPVYRRGRIVRVEHRRSDALAIALLSGRERLVDDYRHQFMTRRRKLKADFAELDRQREEEQRKAEQIWAEHQAILDKIEPDNLLKSKPQPRVVRL
jgi:hypothetical protein